MDRPMLWLAPVAFLLVAAAQAAVDPVDQWRLVGLDTAQGDEFGFANDIDGNTAVVGAPYSDSAVGFRSGSAYVFVRSGAAWTQQKELIAFDRSADAQFGGSVGVSGDTVVVGASNDGEAAQSAGAAYVFERSGTSWTQIQKLVAPDATQSDAFGEAVDVDGGTMIVGARFHASAGPGSGTAYVFTRTGSGGTSWALQQQLTAGDGSAGDNFGVIVALSGDTAVVGAPYAGPSRSGAAYVFVRSGSAWTLQQKLEQSGAPVDQAFGYHVAIDGDTVIVGAPDKDDESLTAPGAAYVFVRSGSTWTQQQRLAGTDSGQHDRFGRAVAVSGDVAVLAAPRNDGAAQEAGAVYVFTRLGSTWSQLRKITAIDAGAGDKFGLFLSLDGTTAVSGAPLHGDPAQDAGSAYVLTDITAPVPPGGGPPPVDPGPVESFLLPKSLTVKSNGASGTASITATGIFDPGTGSADLTGAARLDIGPVDVVIPGLVRRGRNLVFSGDGVKFVLTPATNGSSKTTFKLTYRGARAASIARDGQVVLNLRMATVEGDAVVNLVGGKFVLGKTPNGLVAPTIYVQSASATLRGGGRDSLSTVVGFAPSTVPTGTPPAMVVGFGANSFDLTGATFLPAKSAFKFVGDMSGIRSVVLNQPAGTLTVKGSNLTLGDFAFGPNIVPVTVKFGTEERQVRVRMGRKGSKLTY